MSDVDGEQAAVLTLEEYKTVRFWSGRIAPSTYKTYIGALRQFMKWLDENGGSFSDLTPDGLVNYQKNADNGAIYDILDLVQTWAQCLRTPEGIDCRVASKKSAYSAVRSFFTHNRAPLPRDAYTLRSETPESEGTLTIENIRDVALASKPLYRAVFLSMFQGALDLKGFLYWNEHGLEDLQRELNDPYTDIVKIKLPWRKNNRKPYYTMIGQDAIKAIRDYMPSRPTEEEARAKHESDEKRRARQAEEAGRTFKPRPFYYAIFYSMFKTPLQKVTLQHFWIEKMDTLGLIKRVKGNGVGVRYGKHIHELRDVFRSQWEKSPAKASVAEFCMGHRGDALQYNKAYRDEDWTREQYHLAVPFLEIMSSARPYGLVKVSPRQMQFQEEFAALLEDERIRAKFLSFLDDLKQ